jgi:predicted ATP-grasp superfamily ATP-dependent carboligase
MNNNRDRVLITEPIDGCRMALLAVRCLGKKGIESTLMAQNFRVPTKLSRWRSESIYCPSASSNLEGYLKCLIGNARTGRYLTLFPLGDSSLLPVSEHRAKLTPYLKLALPSHNSVLKALDKSETISVAVETGVPIPETFLVKSREEVVDISRRIEYPAVVKPRWSFFWGRDGKANYSRAFYVNSARELVATYPKVAKNFPEPMIQEYIPGHNVSVAMLFDHGDPRAACMIGVERTSPVTGGNSVLRESIPPDPKLIRYASNLLRRLSWHGVTEVEFRIDSRDSTPKLMEINARFWGSMCVAIESGVDFPYMQYLLAKGELIPQNFNYKTGVKFRWLNGDFDNLHSVLRGMPRLTNTEHPSKLKAILRFLKLYEKNLHYDGLDQNDPLPFLMDEALFVCKSTLNFTTRMLRH